jgi:hypothetical protein
MDLERLIFDFGPHIRYVAFGNGQDVRTAQREGLQGASAEGSDFYEELLVNPTLLRLATQRGDLDCGGLAFLVVGYGNFNEVVVPASASSHVSVSVDSGHDAIEVARRVVALLSGDVRSQDQSHGD